VRPALAGLAGAMLIGVASDALTTRRTVLERVMKKGLLPTLSFGSEAMSTDAMPLIMNLVGLEEALEGKEKGATLKVSVPPAKGYGERDASLSQIVPREMFDIEELEPGMRFHAEGEHGTHVVTVTAVDNDSVTVDANHPLAGQTLNFEVTVMGVRAATEQELAHGHVHGPHGHDH